jgi:hypothetical protein
MRKRLRAQVDPTSTAETPQTPQAPPLGKHKASNHISTFDQVCTDLKMTLLILVNQHHQLRLKVRISH